MFKLACEKANHICDKSQYKEASLWQRLCLSIHLLYCKACQEYTAKNRKLSKTIKKSDLKTLSNKEKAQLTSRLQDALNK